MKRIFFAKTFLIVAIATVWIGSVVLAQTVTRPSLNQIAVMLFVDYGRSYGYQTMMARIQLDSVRAALSRDEELLRQKEQLYKKKRFL